MRSSVFVAAVVAVVAGGCGPKPTVGTMAPSLPPCDTIGSTATTPSRGQSLAYAQRSLSQLYPDARGDLLGVGYRRIRVISRTSTCVPYKIGGLNTGLISCTVRARICGR